MRDQYYHYKASLSKLLREQDQLTMSEDDRVVNHLFNLLTESRNVEKIKGVISSSVISKYGGDIGDYEVERLYEAIIGWFEPVREAL